MPQETLNFTGNHEEPEWVRTGLYSLDRALRWDDSTIGWPTRSITQVYGLTSIGKSTFINSVACILGRMLDLPVSCLDLEHQSGMTIQAIASAMNYTGWWKWVEPDAKQEDKFSDEHLLNQLRKDAEDGYITILDSVAMVSPVAEDKGNVGDRIVGARAYSVAQYIRGVGRRLKWNEKPIVSFLANHKYEDIATGLPFKTSHAPGGAVKDNINFINIDAKLCYYNKKKMHFDDGWVFEGKVIKNRFGVSGDTFWVYIVGGRGVHFGLTSMFDCVKFGLAEIKKGGNIFITYSGEDLGRVTKIISERDDYDFDIFKNLLDGYQKELEAEAKPKDVEYVQDEDEEDEENNSD